MRISPEAGKAAFRLAVFIIVLAALVLLLVRPGSREFVITVLTLVIGLAVVGLVAILTRFAGRP